jgi:hypothetical protein
MSEARAAFDLSFSMVRLSLGQASTQAPQLTQAKRSIFQSPPALSTAMALAGQWRAQLPQRMQVSKSMAMRPRLAAKAGLVT